jgi:predicted ArsR family transcriptional regulator
MVRKAITDETAGMIVDRKEQGSTRQSILQLLRRHGAMTALELSEALHVGAVGVRQHLALLERDGMVAITGLRRNVGRPSHLYGLTAEAEERFPKRYDTLALDVIACVSEVGGAEAVENVLAARRGAMARQLAPALAGKSREEQVAILAALLAEQGYMCECEQQPDGSFVLSEYNCPVDCVARKHPQICAQEILLYEELLGVPLTRDGTIAEGAHCCRYHIPA